MWGILGENKRDKIKNEVIQDKVEVASMAYKKREATVK